MTCHKDGQTYVASLDLIQRAHARIRDHIHCTPVSPSDHRSRYCAWTSHLVTVYEVTMTCALPPPFLDHPCQHIPFDASCRPRGALQVMTCSSLDGMTGSTLHFKCETLQKRCDQQRRTLRCGGQIEDENLHYDFWHKAHGVLSGVYMHAVGPLSSEER